MARKRMISEKVIETDLFIDMNPSAQLLYIHLCLHADDDGLLGNYKITVRGYGSEQDLQELIKNNYVFIVDAVLVITHWKVQNAIRSDRYTPTLYQDEYSRLICDEKSKMYAVKDGSQGGIPSGSHGGIPSGMHSIDKVKEIKTNISKVSSNTMDTITDTTSDNKKLYGEYRNIGLADAEYQSLCNDYSKSITDKTLNRMSNNIKKKNGNGYPNPYEKAREWIEKDYNPEQIKEAQREETVKVATKDKLRTLELMAIMNCDDLKEDT